MMFISRLYSSVVVCNSSVTRLLLVCTRLSLGGSFRIDLHERLK